VHVQHAMNVNHDHLVKQLLAHPSLSLSHCCNCSYCVFPLLLLLMPCGPHTRQAGGALTRYHVNAVVANLLHTRKDRVLIVQQGSSNQGHQQQQQQQQVVAGRLSSSADLGEQLQVMEVLRATDEPHIEKQLVAKIVALHEQFQLEQQQKQSL